MPRKNPLSFEQAIVLAHQKYHAELDNRKFAKAFWYTDNFIEYISNLGFHIELSGDEFELVFPAQPT